MDLIKLKEMYCVEGKSQRQIAKDMKLSQTTVKYYIKKYSIEKNESNLSKFELSKDEKQCPRCKSTKKLSEFYFQSYKKGRNSRHGSWCKDCMSKQVIDRQQRYKQEAIQYKGGKCIMCGYKTYQGALEFHHIDPTQKDFEISKFSKHTLSDESKKELDKCLLLCSNCHREEHARLKGLI